jgi:hypothetical protein
MIRFIARLLGIRSREQGPSAVCPPRPADWNKTVNDLFQEMKAGLRKTIGQPEIDWAREYTRSLIPDGLRYPRLGDVYEALVDQPVRYMTAWRAAYTGGGESTIRAGERLWVHSEPVGEKPLGVYALPTDYNEMEIRMVPTEERTAAKYNGYYLSVDTVTLLNKYRLVQTGYGPGGAPADAPDSPDAPNRRVVG